MCAALTGMAVELWFQALPTENRLFFADNPTADGNKSLAQARKGGAELKNENEMPDQRWSGV
jgi:hypothetical protein